MAKRKPDITRRHGLMLRYLSEAEEAILRAHKIQKSLRGHLGATDDDIDEINMLLGRIRAQIRNIKEYLCEGG